MSPPPDPTYVATTVRLRLRRYADTPADAATLLAQLNEPSFHRYIGDRGVRTVEQARTYLRDRLLAGYESNGLGMYLVELHDGTPIGLCGFVRREFLPEVDLGYALAPAYWGQGFAAEACGAALVLGRERLGLDRVLAITSKDNDASIRVLERLGFRFEKLFRIPGEHEDVKLFALSLT